MFSPFTLVTLPTRPAQSTIDPKGPAAPILGRIGAINAGLWLLVADVDVAAGWKGGGDGETDDADFQRALQVNKGPIAIGKDKGIIVSVGDCGWSYLFGPSGSQRGVRLTYAQVQSARDKDGKQALAQRVAQWPVVSKPVRVGTLRSPTGMIALLLPYCPGDFSPKLRAKAAKAGAAEHPEGDSALVAMAEGPGVYEMTKYPFRPERGRGAYEDDLGWYSEIVEISYAGPLPAKG
jgi:hypothetical protein